MGSVQYNGGVMNQIVTNLQRISGVKAEHTQ
jgi:hypothetical protein